MPADLLEFGRVRQKWKRVDDILNDGVASAIAGRDWFLWRWRWRRPTAATLGRRQPCGERLEADRASVATSLPMA